MAKVELSRDRPAAPPRARQDHAPPEEDVAEAAHRGTTDSRPGSVEPCGAGGGWFEHPFPKPGEERPSREGELHAGGARDAVRGRRGGVRRDRDPRAAAGGERGTALIGPARKL